MEKKKPSGIAGKRFEEDIKNSIPENIFCYRLKDAGGWSNATNMRFTSSNLCDFIINYNGYLFLLELKSVKDNSMPLGNLGAKEITNKKTGITTIEYPKLDKMIEAGNKDNTMAMYLINFRSSEETYLLTAKDFKEIITRTGKKSISLQDINTSNKGEYVRCSKKVSRYRYEILDSLYEFVQF